MTVPESIESRRSAPAWRKFLPLAVLVALAVLVFAMGWHRYLSLDMLLARRAEAARFVAAHYLPAVLGFILLYTAAVALSLPGAVFLTLASGILFGGLVGGLAAIVAATAGATLVFLLARYALADLIRARLGPRLSKIAEGFRADAFGYLLFLRLVPAFPFWLVNLASAFLDVRLRTFVAATFLGIIPATFAFAFFGSGLDSVLAAQQAAQAGCVAQGGAACAVPFNIRQVLTPQLLAGLTALGVAALIPIAVRRWSARRARSA
jgi:uncharacterized membrane protein YdjX (TVP38/TMEM64 family)